MSKREIKPDEMVASLRLNIMWYDPSRPPLSWGLFPHSLSVLIELTKKDKIKGNIKYNRTFYNEISLNSKPFRFDTEIRRSDYMYMFVLLILMTIFVETTTYFITVHFSLSKLQSILFLTIIAIPSIYLYLLYLIKRRRAFLGEKHNTEIKKVVQMLIDHAVELIKENNLDPHDYPIKIKHNDYEGLTFNKQENNEYLGYFKI